jgi:hypothetical protein
VIKKLVVNLQTLKQNQQHSMENNILNEDTIKEVLDKVILEQVSKVSRQDFSRVQFKIEELQNSLNETVKELRKLEESVPSGLKNLTNGRVNGMRIGLSNSQKLLQQLKDKIRQYKKSLYSQPIQEKK